VGPQAVSRLALSGQRPRPECVREQDPRARAGSARSGRARSGRARSGP